MKVRRQQFYFLIGIPLCLVGFWWQSGAGQDSFLTAGTNKADLLWKRAEWFYQQRAYPLDRIPAGFRLNALEELNNMLAVEGKSAGPSSRGTFLTAPSTTPAIQGIAASTTQWTLIGPQPAIPLGDPAGGSPNVSGRVTALAVDPRNSAVVYLGAAEGGVWKTTDGGSTWTPITDFQPSLAVGSIALDPSNPNTVYVGTGEENFGIDNYYGDGVLKSTDGGTTWTQLPGSFAGPRGADSFEGGAFIGSIAVNPGNSQILLAAASFVGNLTTSGIYRSTDGGVTWTEVLSGADGTAVVFDPTNGNNAYAALGDPIGNTSNGVYKSLDGGQTWTRSSGTGTNVLPSTNLGRIAMALAASSPTTVYVGIGTALGSSSTSSLLGLYKTVDGGLNWTKLSTTPDYCTPQCWFNNIIAVSPTSASVIFGGGINQTVDETLVRSLDGGTTWTTVSEGANGVNLHTDMHALAFSSDGATLYVGNDGGSWSTTNITSSSVNWTSLNSGLAITQFYPAPAIDPTTINTAFGGTQDNSTQKYTGSLTWNAVTCGDGGWSAIDPSSPSTVYTACAGLILLLKSTSSGNLNTWFPAVSGIGLSDRVSFVPPLVIDPSNPQALYFGTYRVYRTANGAASWTVISSDLTGGGTADITTLAVASSDSNTVYVGTSDSQVQVTTNASAGTGVSWAKINTGLPPRYITQMAVDPKNAKIAYVTFSGFSGFGDTAGHVFQTTNGGTSWTDISGNLPNIPVNDIVVDPDFSNTLYVATDLGVFQTTNAGMTWSTLVSGLPNVAVLGLKLHEATRILRAATHGRSVWDLQLPSPSGATAVLSTPILLFANQLVGTTSPPQTVTLANNGTASLTITSVLAGGDFAATSNCGSSLAAGTNCTINVTFSPKAAGVSSGTLTITDNALNSPQIVTLTGTGASPAVSLSATSLSFANQNVGTTSSPQTVTLTNTGTVSLTINSVTISSEFAQTNTCASVVAANASCTFTVTFNPTAPGSASGKLTISDNAGDSPQVVNLNGTGLGPTVTLSSTSLTFASQAVGSTSASQVVTLNNTGNASLTIASITVAGANSKDFAQTNNCGSSAAAGAKCTINPIFTPTATGTRAATLTITDNAAGSPHTVALSGTGSDFSLSVASPSSTVTAGQSASYKLNVTPAGGFNQTVSLACSGAPLQSTCSVTPSSVTPNGISAATSTVSVSTTTRSLGVLRPKLPPSWGGRGGRETLLFWLVALALLGGLVAGRRRARLIFGMMILYALLSISCGGGGGNPGTPAGTYTLTLTGTSGGLTHKTTVNLTVN